MNTRIYEVILSGRVETKLVRASYSNQAIRYAARGIVKAEVATQERCVELGKNGLEIEVAG